MSPTESKKIVHVVDAENHDGNAEHGAHGHHDEDGGWHAAEHQVEHRVSEKAGFGLAEHVIEQAAEKTSERLVQHGAEIALEHGAEIAGERLLKHGSERVLEAASERVLEHGAEVVGERLLERSAEVVGERLLERSAEAVGERLVVRGVAGATQLGGSAMGENIANKTVAHGSAHVAAHVAHSSLGWLQIIRTLVPMAGTLCMLHMFHQDWHRLHREWHKSGVAFTTLLFLCAALCDGFDVVVHVCVVLSLTLMHIDHHFLHSIESWSMYGAVGALSSMVAGELLSARASKHEEKTKKE